MDWVMLNSVFIIIPTMMHFILNMVSLIMLSFLNNFRRGLEIVLIDTNFKTKIKLN